MFNKKSNLNPVEKYLKEVRMSLLLDGYNLSNGVLVDPSVSKELLKQEMRRVESYLAAREEMSMSRKLK